MLPCQKKKPCVFGSAGFLLTLLLGRNPRHRGQCGVLYQIVEGSEDGSRTPAPVMVRAEHCERCNARLRGFQEQESAGGFGG
jgi:hypothetical protein